MYPGPGGPAAGRERTRRGLALPRGGTRALRRGGRGAMADVSGAGDTSLPLSLEQRVDAVCLRYEGAWKAGQRARPEDFLDGGAGQERAALLRDLIALAEHYRWRGLVEALEKLPRDQREVVTRRDLEGRLV